MPNLNKVMLMGNMTRDPQLSYLPSQTPVVEFGLAINRTFKKQDGSQGQEVCFVDVQMFGKRAEVINKYFKKGDPVFIEGRLKFDSWEKEGKKYTKLRVMAEGFEFIGKKPASNNPNNQESQEHPDYDDSNLPTGRSLTDDDIPF